MPMILENISKKSLIIVTSTLLLCQIVCFIVGGICARFPGSFQEDSLSLLLNETVESEQNVLSGCENVSNLQLSSCIKGVNEKNFVYIFKIPKKERCFSRWQQHLSGLLRINIMNNSALPYGSLELLMQSEISYYEKKKSNQTCTRLASATIERSANCACRTNKNDNDVTSSNCSLLYLFELGSLYYGQYLLNLRIPVQNQTMNKYVKYISNIYLYLVYLDKDFVKVMFSLKACLFSITIVVSIRFWLSIFDLPRDPVTLEYMLLILSIAASAWNMPIDFLTLEYDIPCISLFNTIRWILFYIALSAFWLIFINEHMIIEATTEQHLVQLYLPFLAGILASSLLLIIIDTSDGIIKMHNPFKSLWLTREGKLAATVCLALAETIISAYFLLLLYMAYKVLLNFNYNRRSLSCTSAVHRLHKKGVIYRFNILLVYTLICIIVTYTALILNHHQMEYILKLRIPSSIVSGVYGMWTIYVWVLLIACAPCTEDVIIYEPILLKDKRCQCNFSATKNYERTTMLSVIDEETSPMQQPSRSMMVIMSLLCRMYRSATSTYYQKVDNS